MEEGELYIQGLVEKPEGKRPRGTLRRRLDDSSKMYLQDIS